MSLVLFKCIVAVSIVALILYHADVATLALYLQNAETLFVTVGTLSFLFGQMVASYRWRLILSNGQIFLKKGYVYQLHLIGCFASNFLPGQAAGDVVKVALLCKQFNNRKSFLVASILLDRLLGFAAILLIGLGFIFIFDLDISTRSNSTLSPYILLIILLIFMVIMLLRLSALKGWVGLLSDKIRSRMKYLSTEFIQLVSQWNLLVLGGMLSLLFQLSWALCLYFMLVALSVEVPFYQVVVASTIATFVAILPISFGGLGVREGSFVFILGKFGVEHSAAVAAAILSLLPILISTLLGAMLMHKHTLRMSSTSFDG